MKACLSHPADPHLLALAVQCVEEAREVSPELRSLVSARLNPPDIGENRDNRRIAAWARLLLRPSKDLRLERGKFIGPEFTWVEYQCFLDDAATRGQVHIPDHWVEAVFPPGTEDQPAHGVRYDDARAFCGWLQSELGGDDIYRLPSSREIDAAISLSTDSTRIEEARWPVWSITKQAIGVDGRFGVLLRDRRANERNVPYLGARTSLSPADRNILRSIEAEQAKLSAPGFTASATQGRPSSDMACQLLEEAWSSFSACDAGQLARDMQTSSSLLRQYIDKCSLPGEGADLQNALVHMADVLDAEAPASFDRRAYKWRQSDRALESRRKLRLAVLYAGDACAQLHSLHNQAARQAVAGRWVGRRAHRYRKEAPARTVAVLAQALMEIYVELVVLEGRVRKLLQPTECVRMVRLTTGQESEGLVDLDEQIRDRDWNLWLDLGKPVVDRLVAACALIALLPFLLVVAAIVRTDGGPVLFFQTRIGKRGRQFNMVKFRSMVVDADRLRAELLEANEGAGPLFKMRADPRVTKFGRWMRRYGIDEFPQLLNVLAGSMSLVGPRPPLPGGVSTFSAEASRKFLVKPGLTGLGQVSGGSDISWEELVRLDLRYVENASLALDSTILVRTLGSLISGSGRY